ncbi:survival protein sure-like phosphatase/nucleotidase [Echria macrotheca]|uniref:Survival protein sure-like phosphatase/nucleotidase n=1 Tax=Echria macrotheca TaxID=438768 RepID=A0AAJ0B4K4_9PEZI|nr:survival protein sure-like phosphatase/nucleotidase [Echria macrotheca]
MRYGLDTFGPQAWNNGLPDLAVAGPNVGSNVYLQVHFSGTVGAAVYAAQRGIPSIAFSGLTTGNAAWDTTPVPARSLVYAELAGMLVDTLAAQEKPYLPPNVWLNVNFGAVGGEGCTRAADFKWVLSRINIGLFSAPDTPHCGTTRLPSEIDVVNRGCFVSVSVGDARDKSTAPAADQAVVVQKLGNLLSCP